MKNMRLGIIGCGNMGEAILKGVLSGGILRARQICVADISRRRAKNMEMKYRVVSVSSNNALVRRSNVIIISVKPQHSRELLEEISQSLSEAKLLVSIMAGVTLKGIAGMVGGRVPVARVMPNMAAIVGEAVSGISYSRYVTDRNKRSIRKLLKGVGHVYEVHEGMQDLITAVTGSGPAYFMYFAEALIETAARHAMPYKDAIRLVVQTMVGSSILLREAGTHPEILRRKVTSKGGTTEAAIRVFEKARLMDTIHGAVTAARKRSRELSR
ncbi:MAG: pyrroline-5-carboxylate reductase [Candidatus Omnitrophota bacterium]